MRSTVDLGWGRVSYLDWAPDGAPVSTVVLLHGGGVDNASLSWGEIGPALAGAGHRVVAPDHPGYGRSAAPPWPSTQERLVGYVGEFIDALGIDRYVIGGLSLGGGMAIGHVLDRSEKVCGAILLDSYGLMPRSSDGPFSAVRQALLYVSARTGVLASAMRRLARNGAALRWSVATLIRNPEARTPALMAQVRAAVHSGGGLAAFGQWQRDQFRWSGLRTDYTSRLASIDVPTLIVHGARDAAVPMARARAAARLIPDARLVVVPGAGHWVQRDAPAAVLTALRDFLGRV